jgi:hypothetical protein
MLFTEADMLWQHVMATKLSCYGNEIVAIALPSHRCKGRFEAEIRIGARHDGIE